MKCKICGHRTSESLRAWKQRRFWRFHWQGLEGTPYCRSHLIEAFNETLRNFRKPVVFFYPDLESKTGSYQYSYVCLKELEREKDRDTSGYTKASLALLENAFAQISGQCFDCKGPADSAVFPKGSFSWGPGASFLSERFDQPKLDMVHSGPKILCRRCALKSIGASLLEWKGEFGDGIIGPKSEKGFYWTTEV